MDWSVLHQKLASLFQTETCLEITNGIWETDRWNSRDKNEQTARYCGEVLRSAGLSQVELLPLKTDGKTRYFDKVNSQSWDISEGTLHYADGELITDYQDLPCCVASYCPPTPPEGVEAEVVIPVENDPDPEKYKGKVLLVREPANQWTAFAVKTGAVGILSDFMVLYPGIRETREVMKDEVMWMGGPSNYASNVFCFHLTPRQGDKMREKLQKGSVRVRAKVTSRIYDGLVYTVSAALEGTEPELPEVLLYGHLYEPGANDNAAGAAAVLHLAQVFANAVETGLLSRPRRTIRFAVGYEYGGSIGYVASHFDRPLLCGMITDMIGTETGDNATMILRYDPVSNWSYADGALFALHRIAHQYYGHSNPVIHGAFAMDTDNILADPSLHCPTVAMCAAPALSYHTSMDRPDRIEPETLKRNAVMAGTYVWGFAQADSADCPFLADAIREQGERMIAEADHPRKKRMLQDAIGFALHSLNRIAGQVAYPKVEFDTDPAPDYAKDGEKRIPERLVPGMLTFHGTDIGARMAGRWNGNPQLPVFWIDGKRNLWQIAYLSAVEKGFCTDEQLRQEYECLCDYFDALAEYNYIRWIAQ